MTRSKPDWQNEDLSALFDGEDLPAEKLSFKEDDVEHLKAWSLIGATMRHELGNEVNLSLADNIAAAVAKEKAPVSDQAEIKTPRYNIWKAFHKFGFIISQAAIAASIAMVTVIGYQTYNVVDNLGQDNAPVAALGPISNVNLASYQSVPNNNVIRLGDGAYNGNLNTARQAEIRNSQNKEMELINDYIRLYVLTPSAQ